MWHELHPGKYRDIAPERDGSYRSRVFPGLWLNPAALWAGDFKALAASAARGLKFAAHKEFVKRLTA